MRIALLSVLLLIGCDTNDTEELPYRGQNIAFHFGTTPFNEACENDSMSLSPAEAARLEALLLGAPVPALLPDRNAMVAATGELKVPGFGLTEYNDPQTDGTTLWLVSIEVPCRAKNRVLLFSQGPHGFRLLDDFVHARTAPYLFSAAVTGETAQYKDRDGKAVLTHTIRPLPAAGL